MKPQITTKHDELKFRTAEKAQMLNRYLADNVIAEYPEDFIDDKGEKVTIKRSQKLFDRGTYIDQEIAAKITFYIQSGDISEVIVSNQNRLGFGYAVGRELWITQIRLIKTDTKYKLMAYANGIVQLLDIITDYCEQKFDGGFEILNTKKLEYHRVIIDEIKKKDTSAEDYLKDKITGEEYAWSQYKGAKDESDISVADFKYYQIEAKFDYIDRPGLSTEHNYIVYTYDASKAERLIMAQMAKEEAEATRRGDTVERKTLSLEKVSQLAVSYYIPMEFTDAYSLQHKDNEK